MEYTYIFWYNMNIVTVVLKLYFRRRECSRMILNVGCGYKRYGDVRADIFPTPAVNIILDADSPLPFKSEVFDEVYCRCLFEHLKNPNFFLCEVKRILKPKVKLVLITDNASYIPFHIAKFLSLRVGWRHGSEYPSMHPLDKHYSFYQLEHLQNHFQSVGLKIIETKLLSYIDSEKPLGKLDCLVNLLLGKNFAFPKIKVVAIKL